MFGYKITRDKEIINAIKIVAELDKVLTILKIDVAKKENTTELCSDYGLSSSDARRFNISRGSCISAILSLYKKL
jgi:hypothetical protein